MIQLRSVITCPACGFGKDEGMPVDFCVLLYTCGGCDVTLRPATGDCCVFCTFGSIPCPPNQNRTMNTA
ncbi:MAG: GDCCVxC domain-containing (seleno)protein [Alphaproteobacteria bacterium]